MKEQEYNHRQKLQTTMLRVFSKCEVKVQTVLKSKNMIATQFYVKSLLAKFKSQKLQFFTISENLKFEFW